ILSRVSYFILMTSVWGIGGFGGQARRIPFHIYCTRLSGFVNVLPKFKKNKFGKKIKIIAITLCTVLCIALGLVSVGDKQTIKVYNAGEYIDTELISIFEEDYGCSVVYETFDSNESMYTNVMSGEKYDIIIPSDYMIERLIKEDFLQEIDHSKLENYYEVIPSLLDKEFDPGNRYSIPYFWGSVGILYDKTVVSEEDLKAGWEVLRNPKYKDDIYMYDSERDSFMVALKALGYSLNTTDTSELDEAYKWLIEQRDIMNPIYIGDEVIDSMISGSKAMAFVYSGDAAYIMSENENMGFYEPENGTNIWIDGMVMTKVCTNTDLAHKFIDFMLDPDNAYSNSEAVGYSSSVTNAFEEIRDNVYIGIDAYVPRQNYPKDEIFKYQEPEIKKYSAELWTKVKAQ
ncbi:MAG: ABC transporter substrate-binding protein, partial [Clostridia bacterium]|nr:ABC transporter substrate-binding protein [Clostridia bacterium]